MVSDSSLVILVRQARRGRRDALDRLIPLVQTALEPFFVKKTGQYQLTGDLVQETLLALIVSIGNLQRAESFWPWIYRIAYSKLQQHYRRRQYEGTVTVSTQDLDVCSPPSLNNDTCPLRKLIREEDYYRLTKALD